jgi:hypothetical protein
MSKKYVPSPRPCETFHNMLFLWLELLAPAKLPSWRSILLSVHNCLFNVFAATLNIWGPPLSSVTLKYWQFSREKAQVPTNDIKN